MKKLPNKNNQQEKIDSKASKEEVTKSTPVRHQKFVVQSPKYGTPLMIGLLVFVIGIVSIILTLYWDWICLGVGVQVILMLVYIIIEGYRLVIDEKGIHLFTGDVLYESIKWSQIKRIETGRFGSFAIWKDHKRIEFTPVHFSPSGLKRARELIISHLERARPSSRTPKPSSPSDRASQRRSGVRS
jgi:hypothetical protein